MSNRTLTARELEAIFLNVPKVIMRKMEPAMKEAVDNVAKDAIHVETTNAIYAKAPHDKGYMAAATRGEVRTGRNSIQGYVLVDQPANPKRSDYYYPLHPYEGTSTSRDYGPRRFLRNAGNRQLDKTREILTRGLQSALGDATH